MAQWHLQHLRNRLLQRGWTVVAELDGDDYKISATWAIQRTPASPPLIIDFDGLDDMETLPLERAYACHWRGHAAHALYFGRKGHKSSARRKSWETELAAFVAGLDKPSGPTKRLL